MTKLSATAQWMLDHPKIDYDLLEELSHFVAKKGITIGELIEITQALNRHFEEQYGRPPHSPEEATEWAKQNRSTAMSVVRAALQQGETQ